jgi:protein transport protein SEC31
VARSEGFEVAIQGGNLSTLRDYCLNKAALAGPTTPEAETWSYLAVLFEGDEARRCVVVCVRCVYGARRRLVGDWWLI